MEKPKLEDFIQKIIESGEFEIPPFQRELLLKAARGEDFTYSQPRPFGNSAAKEVVEKAFEQMKIEEKKFTPVFLDEEIKFDRKAASEWLTRAEVFGEIEKELMSGGEQLRRHALMNGTFIGTEFSPESKWLNAVTCSENASTPLQTMQESMEAVARLRRESEIEIKGKKICLMDYREIENRWLPEGVKVWKNVARTAFEQHEKPQETDLIVFYLNENTVIFAGSDPFRPLYDAPVLPEGFGTYDPRKAAVFITENEVSTGKVEIREYEFPKISLDEALKHAFEQQETNGNCARCATFGIQTPAVGSLDGAEYCGDCVRFVEGTKP